MRTEAGLRAVLDTNVWISAALSRAGTPALLVRRVLEHGQPVFSTHTFAELEARLWLPKFDSYLSLEDRKLLLHDAVAVAHWVDISAELSARSFSRDASDDKFIHAALAASAPWLVTGDKDLLAVSPVPDLQILTPAEAMKQFERAH